MNYKINVGYNNQGIITSDITCEFNGYTENVYKGILNTQEELIKKSLIELGWTPPECTQSSSGGKKEINEKIRNAIFVALSLIKRFEKISENEEDIYSRRLEIDAVKTLIKAAIGNK